MTSKINWNLYLYNATCSYMRAATTKINYVLICRYKHCWCNAVHIIPLQTLRLQSILLQTHNERPWAFGACDIWINFLHPRSTLGPWLDRLLNLQGNNRGRTISLLQVPQDCLYGWIDHQFLEIRSHIKSKITDDVLEKLHVNSNRRGYI